MYYDFPAYMIRERQKPRRSVLDRQLPCGYPPDPAVLHEKAGTRMEFLGGPYASCFNWYYKSNILLVKHAAKIVKAKITLEIHLPHSNYKWHCF